MMVKLELYAHTTSSGCMGSTAGMKHDAFIDLDWGFDGLVPPMVPKMPKGRLFNGETDGSSSYAVARLDASLVALAEMPQPDAAVGGAGGERPALRDPALGRRGRERRVRQQADAGEQKHSGA